MRILMTAIKPRKESIGPPGIHLRWNLPSELESQGISSSITAKKKYLGFPEKGFTIYRRPHKITEPKKLEIPGIKQGEKPEILKNSDAYLYPDPQTKLISSGDGWKVIKSGQLLIRFKQPVVYCEVEFDDATQENEIIAYQGRHRLQSDQTIVEQNRMRVIANYFDHVLLTLNFKRLKQISFYTEADYCAQSDWERLITLDRLEPNQHEDALDRLENGLHNRYAKSRSTAVEKYAPHIGEILVNQILIVGNNTDAQIPASDFTDDCPQGIEVGNLSARNLLLTGASDPNLAKIMGLYWVDQFTTKRGPSDKQIYDYKVEGLYKDKPVCGLVLTVGKDFAPLPQTPNLEAAVQLPGLRWYNRHPLSRIGLHWEQTRNSAPTSVILYDIYRQSKTDDRFKRLSESLPIAMQSNGNATNDLPSFVDINVPLGAYSYQISGIDIFGQESEASKPKQIEVKDATPPPPPVRLKCSVLQPGYPWNDPEKLKKQINQNGLDINTAQIQLSFEYGYAQHRQAPDAKLINLYWREKNLRIVKKAETIQVKTTLTDDELKQLKIELKDFSEQELQQFDGGVLSIKSRNGEELPNSGKTPIRIEKIDSTWVVLRPSQIQVLKGDICELTSDIHNRDNWRGFGRKIKIQPPLQAEVAKIRDLNVKIRGRHEIPKDESDSVAEIVNTFPGNLRPKDSPSIPPVTELFIDHVLLEPNLFSNGKLILNDNKIIPIVYSTAGIAYSQILQNQPSLISRIAVDPSHSIEINQNIVLNSPQDKDMYGDPIRYVIKETILEAKPSDFDLSASGGEIVFEGIEKKCGEYEAVAVTARVVSTARKQSETKVSLLVKFRSSDWKLYGESGWLSDKTIALYYAPYMVGPLLSSIIHNANTDQTPSWNWSAETGIFRGYIAATATDDRSLEGSLSQPVEASAFKPPPIGRPNPPIPCDLTLNDLDSTNRWYASLPDLNGLATACLKWTPDGINEAEGLRCEIARALDTTIIEADKKNWLLGLHEPGFPPVSIDIVQVRDSNSNDGYIPTDLFIVQFKPLNNDNSDKAFYSGGIFIQDNNLFVLTGHRLTQTGSDENTLFEASVKSFSGAAVNTTQHATFYRGGIVQYQGVNLTLNNSTTTPHSGRVILTMDLPDELDLTDTNVRKKFIGIRLSTPVNTESGQQTNFFKVLQISQQRDDDGNLIDRMDFLLQPQIGKRTKIGAQVTLHAAPNYDFAKSNDSLLRDLADKTANISAFGVVTGTPISPHNNEFKFRDQLPGIGSNRYFYKARGKDASENNTPWSQTSIPFYQVDVSPPKLPLIESVTGGDRKATIFWKTIQDPQIVSYKIYRIKTSLSDAEFSDYEHVTDLFKEPSANQLPLQLAPLKVSFGNISIHPSIKLPEDISLDSSGSHFTGVYRLQNGGAPDTTINYLSTTTANTVSGQIINLPSSLPDGSKVVVTASDQFTVSHLINKSMTHNNMLTATGGVIDLRFPYNLNSVSGVYKALAFDFEADPLDQQTATNYFGANSNYNPATFRVTNLDSSLEDGSRVVILLNVTNDAGEQKLIPLTLRPGTDHSLVVSQSSVAFHIDFSTLNIEGVYLAKDYNSDRSVDQQEAPNYFTQLATQYNDEIRNLKYFHAPLTDGDLVAIAYKDSAGSEHTISAIPDLFAFTDDPLEGLLPHENYYYRLISIKRVQISATVGDYIDIPSLPSDAVPVRVIDTSPPPPPEWVRAVWWDIERDATATSETEAPVALLEWKTDIPATHCVVYRKYSHESPWIRVSNELEPVVPSNNGEHWYRYIDDSATLNNNYEFRIQIKNAFEKINVAHNPIALQKMEPES